MPRTHTDTRLCGAIGQTAPTHSRSGRPTHPKLHPSHNAGTRASLRPCSRSSQHEHLRPARTPVRIRIRAGSSVASEAPLAVCIPQSAHVMAKIAFPSAGEHARSPPSSPRQRVHRRPGYSAYLWRAVPRPPRASRPPRGVTVHPLNPLVGTQPGPPLAMLLHRAHPFEMDNEGKGV